MSIDKTQLDSLRIERPQEEMRTKRGLWFVLVGVAAVAIALLAFAIARPRATVVKVAPAKAVAMQGRTAVLNASGYVTARRQSTVSSKVTGKIVDVRVEEGMHVKAGQELARLDNAMVSKGLALAAAEAQASASSLEETRVQIRQSQLEYERAKHLESSQISSRADLDRAQAQLDALKARLVAQTDSFAVAQRQVQLRNQDLEDTIIRAPFDGIVVSKDAQPGEMISPMSAGGGFTRTGICTIVDMDSLEIEVDVAEAYINRVRPEQPVEAVLDAYPDWKIAAHVITAVPTADRQKATVKVRIAFNAKDPRVLPDMGVKTTFIDTEQPAENASAVDIPKSAIRRDGDRDVVFVVNGGRAERRAVRVASSDNERARVSAGLTAGESVIVEAPAELKDGDRIRVRVEESR
jgi:RND family efflux transporter MFP subunit